jgi:hypothetical protein
VDTGGQGANEIDHGGMEGAIETESQHFGESVIRGPILKGNAVGSDENAGAIAPKFAVNENGLRRRLFEKREKLGELLVGRSGKGANRNVDETHAEGCGFAAFLIDFRLRFSAQIDDSSDAEIFQHGKTRKIGLCTAKKRVGDFSSVVNAGHKDFLTERRSDGRGTSSGLRAQTRKRCEEKKENEEKRKGAHRELDAKRLEEGSCRKREKR